MKKACFHRLFRWSECTDLNRGPLSPPDLNSTIPWGGLRSGKWLIYWVFSRSSSAEFMQDHGCFGKFGDHQETADPAPL